jgi:hypothetical protein
MLTLEMRICLLTIVKLFEMTTILRPGSVRFLRMLVRFVDHRPDVHTKHLATQLLGTANVTLAIMFYALEQYYLFLVHSELSPVTYDH